MSRVSVNPKLNLDSTVNVQEAYQEMYTPDTPINTDAKSDISSVSPSQVIISPTVSLINHETDATLPMARATSAQLQPAMPSNEIQLDLLSQ